MSLGPPTKPPIPEPVTDELTEKHRLAVIGSLAGKIAHHMNNPLAVIRANVIDMSRRIQETGDLNALRDEQSEVLGEIAAGVDDLLRYVEAMSTFAQADGDVETLDLCELVDTALAVAFSKVRYAVDIQVERPDGAVPIQGCPQQLLELLVQFSFERRLVAPLALGDACVAREAMAWDSGSKKKKRRARTVGSASSACFLAPTLFRRS